MIKFKKQESTQPIFVPCQKMLTMKYRMHKQFRLAERNMEQRKINYIL